MPVQKRKELQQSLFSRGAGAISADDAAKAFLEPDEKVAWCAWAKTAVVLPIMSIVGGLALLIVAVPIVGMLLGSWYDYSQSGVFKVEWNFILSGLSIASVFTGFVWFALRGLDIRMLQCVSNRRVFVVSFVSRNQRPVQEVDESGAEQGPPVQELKFEQIEIIEIHQQKKSSALFSFKGNGITVGFPEVVSARAVTDNLPNAVRDKIELRGTKAADNVYFIQKSK